MNHLIIFRGGISKSRIHFIRAVLKRGDNVTLRPLRKDAAIDGLNFSNIFIEDLQQIVHPESNPSPVSHPSKLK